MKTDHVEILHEEKEGTMAATKTLGLTPNGSNDAE
jgi:hypothetical protein